MHNDAGWMREAIVEAQRGFDLGEVPVGAVVVLDGKVIGRGHNRVEVKGYPFEHAEIVALWDAVGSVGARALTEAVLYSTVEPCVMCIGAAILCRLSRVVYGAREPKTGACESVFDIPNEPRLNHRMAVIGGVEAGPCRELMERFFSLRRSSDG
jgi:tRNA(adenine34) deaminase